jgi:radical SAM protein with 4Fe4S-binding SPASM domain
LGARDAVKIVREMYNRHKQCAFVQFFGGEPTLNFDAMEAVVKEIHRMWTDGKITALPRISMVTNGVYQDPDKIIEFIHRYGVETTVSIDGPAFIHDALRVLGSGGPTHAKVVETLEKLMKSGVPLAAEAVYTSYHIKNNFSLVDLIEYCRDLGVRKLIFEKAYPPAPDSLNPLLDPYFEKLLEYYAEGVDWWFQRLIRGGEADPELYFKDLLLPMLKGVHSAAARDGCLAGSRDFAIGPTGDRYPCQLFYGYGEFRIDNVLTRSASTSPQAFPCRADELDTCTGCFARNWCQPCAALNRLWGDAWKTPPRECALRRAVVLRIGMHAIETLSVPDNDITSILRDNLAGHMAVHEDWLPNKALPKGTV